MGKPITSAISPSSSGIYIEEENIVVFPIGNLANVS